MQNNRRNKLLLNITVLVISQNKTPDICGLKEDRVLSAHSFSGYSQQLQGSKAQQNSWTEEGCSAHGAGKYRAGRSWGQELTLSGHDPSEPPPISTHSAIDSIDEYSASMSQAPSKHLRLLRGHFRSKAQLLQK